MALFYPHAFSLPLFSALFFSSLFLPQESSPPSLRRVVPTRTYKQGITLALLYIPLVSLFFIYKKHPSHTSAWSANPTGLSLQRSSQQSVPILHTLYHRRPQTKSPSLQVSPTLSTDLVVSLPFVTHLHPSLVRRLCSQTSCSRAQQTPTVSLSAVFSAKDSSGDTDHTLSSSLPVFLCHHRRGESGPHPHLLCGHRRYSGTVSQLAQPTLPIVLLISAKTHLPPSLTSTFVQATLSSYPADAICSPF